MQLSSNGTVQLIGATLVVAALGVLLASAADVRAANPGVPAELEAQAQASVLSLITISENANLDFGRIIAPETGNQRFTVSPSGAMVPGPGTGQAVGGHMPGQYDVMGTPGQSYTLTLSADGCTNTLLQLSAIASDASVPTILDQLDIMVGGTLTVGAGIAPGSYQCNYSIMAAFQ